jgi:hypothetical protein
MKKIAFLSAFLFLFLQMSVAQNSGFDYKTPLKKKIGIVKKINEDITVILQKGNDNIRYVANNLPFEYMKDGLEVKFNALESDIPPYIRMVGRPIQLLCIKVSSKEKKKFDLTKRSYKFKK